IVEASGDDLGIADQDLPAVVWARVDLGHRRTMVIATAHAADPLPRDCPAFRPGCFDPSRRDAQVLHVRASLDPFIAHGEPVILLGDFNLTDREAAYRDLTVGLWDAYRIVGAGFGSTWGPPMLLSRGIPLLRIDYA